MMKSISSISIYKKILEITKEINKINEKILDIKIYKGNYLNQILLQELELELQNKRNLILEYKNNLEEIKLKNKNIWIWIWIWIKH